MANLQAELSQAKAYIEQRQTQVCKRVEWHGSRHAQRRGLASSAAGDIISLICIGNVAGMQGLKDIINRPPINSAPAHLPLPPPPYPTCCHQPGSIEQQEALQKRLTDSEQKLALRLTEVDDLRRQRNEYEEVIAVLDDTNAKLQAQVGFT